MEHYSEFFSKSNHNFNLNIIDGWIGGRFIVNNLSGGYHGIEKEMWDFYTENLKINGSINVLLVSESNNIKKIFQNEYSNWNIETTDYYTELQSETDTKIDICKDSLKNDFYNLIICQATFEHLYDPFGAFLNIIKSLKKNGIVVIHTHAPNFHYHSYPRDYFRFMKDWWYDLQNYINVELLEFYMIENSHVFTCYKKI